MCKTKAEFTELVAQFRDLSAKKKKIETKLNAVKAEMTEYILAKGDPKCEGSLTLIVFGDGYKASLIPLNNVTYDGDKLKALLGEDVSMYQNITPYTRIDVR